MLWRRAESFFLLGRGTSERTGKHPPEGEVGERAAERYGWSRASREAIRNGVEANRTDVAVGPSGVEASPNVLVAVVAVASATFSMPPATR